jgi:hypothetical protein
MANTTKKVLGQSISLFVLAAGCANASELWQYSNPLFDSFDLGTTASYQAASSASWANQWSTPTATVSTTQWASSSGDSWFANTAWGGGTTTTSQPTIQSDDLFRNYLFTGSSSASTASATSGGSWFSDYFSSGVGQTSSAQSTGSFWNSYSGWDFGSTSTVNNNTGGWWNQGIDYNSYGTTGASASSGAWWSSYGGFGGSGASSDTTACNMVSSWAGTEGWRSFFDGAPAVTSAPSTSCNQQQASTITQLQQSSSNLVATNGPLVTASDPITIGDNVDNPEPGTWALMGGGLALVAYLRRRRGNSVA